MVEILPPHAAHPAYTNYWHLAATLSLCYHIVRAAAKPTQNPPSPSPLRSPARAVRATSGLWLRSRSKLRALRTPHKSSRVFVCRSASLGCTPSGRVSADAVLALARRAPQVPPAAHDVDARLNFVAPPPAVVESMQVRAHADGRSVPAGSQPWRAKWEWAK